MAFRLHAFTILVPSYDAGIAFYVGGLGFELISDIDLSSGKRWVLIAPDAGATKILLAVPTTDTQLASMGQQTGGRVGFFLLTDDFKADHTRLINAGAVFEEDPRFEPYGTVAVWQDPFGNRWDLLDLK